MGGALLGICFTHTIIERPCIQGVMDVGWGVDIYPPFTFELNETDGREEEAVDELADPAREDKEKVVVTTIHYILKDWLSGISCVQVIVVHITKDDVGLLTSVGSQ